MLPRLYETISTKSAIKTDSFNKTKFHYLIPDGFLNKTLWICEFYIPAIAEVKEQRLQPLFGN